MSEQEYLYVAAVAVTPTQNDREVQLLGATPGSEGSTTELWVQENEPPVPGRHPDATAGYPLEVSVRVYGPDDVQRSEGRRVFDGLREARPDLPLLLTHEGIEAVAVYRPDAGVHDFAPGTEVDPQDFDTWAPWVPRPPD
jgi:hypothetical protein